MIGLEKCRKILQDNGEDYTEKEIEQIRDFLYTAAKIVSKTDSKLKEKPQIKKEKKNEKL